MNNIRLDFLRNLGKVNPAPEDYRFIEALTDQELLKCIVPVHVRSGKTQQQIAIRYRVSIDTIKNICRTNKTGVLITPDSQ